MTTRYQVTSSDKTGKPRTFLDTHTREMLNRDELIERLDNARSEVEEIERALGYNK